MRDKIIYLTRVIHTGTFGMPLLTIVRDIRQATAVFMSSKSMTRFFMRAKFGTNMHKRNARSQIKDGEGK